MITPTQDAAAASIARNGCDKRVAEHYYSLVHWLRTVGDSSGTGAKSIGVTSCASGAGVTTVAANLAIAGAQISEQPVLLLDLSSARPAPATRFSLAGDLDLCDALADASQYGACVRPSPIANLSILAANSASDLQRLNIDSPKANDLLQMLGNDFGFIVVDLPTVESSLCFVTAGLLNGVLLVMEAERTRSDIAARAKQRLVDARANVLGIVLNKHPQHLPTWLEARL